jgi:hypothetical protein
MDRPIHEVLRRASHPSKAKRLSENHTTTKVMPNSSAFPLGVVKKLDPCSAPRLSREVIAVTMARDTRKAKTADPN